jgi:membrane protein DedA with SNARE-associated domain
VFEWLTSEVSNNPVTYLIVFGAAATDVLLPVIPSETIVLAAAVLAGQGDLLIWLIVPAAALGAFLGDNISYWLGRKVGDPVARRFFQGEKARARLEWAERAIQERGVFLIVIGRFIPGGRTATTFASGTLEMPYRRFLVADGCAALIWAAYISLLGYVGGASFEDNLWLPLLIAFGIATLVAVAAEAWRRWQRRRGKDLLGDELEP